MISRIFPNVKNNHVEKTDHPCQFPVELVERLVLSLTEPGDAVFVREFEPTTAGFDLTRGGTEAVKHDQKRRFLTCREGGHVERAPELEAALRRWWPRWASNAGACKRAARRSAQPGRGYVAASGRGSIMADRAALGAAATCHAASLVHSRITSAIGRSRKIA